ncbi:MAG: class I SAM-dependent methyltransferase [Nitrospira sp.]|nr:class I SAM-dependent methyltransferase [Nitrospira sp.]
MNLISWLRPNNWFTFKLFYQRIVRDYPNFRVFVELGVWKGHSLSFLAARVKHREGVKLYGVDLFERWTRPPNEQAAKELPSIYRTYDANLRKAGVRDIVTDLRGLSWEMSDRFEDRSVDFVFVDADHSYESVKKDLLAWLPKIRKGGVFAGHDYCQPTAGVRQAVNEVLGEVKTVEGDVWMLQV